MSLENALWLSSILAKAIFIGLLAYRRAWKVLPVFTIYCALDFTMDITTSAINRVGERAYLTAYLIEIAVGSILEFCVLVELAWSVLRPIRDSLPHFSLVVISFLILALGTAIWPFSTVHAPLTPEGLLLMHLLQTVSVLRVLFFLGLAGCSQLLSLSWRDRELQVVTGLGIYSIVSLGVAMFHTHQASAIQNSFLNRFVVGSYLCSLVYWIICFSQQEAERQEFTPQMRNLLLAMAGVARADREALVQRSITNEPPHRKP